MDQILRMKMINTKKLNADQLAIVKAIVAWGNGAMIYTGKELREFNANRGIKYAPQFITKNLAAKLNKKLAAEYPRGCWNLEVFLKYAEQYPPVEAAVKPKKAPKKTKKVTPKRTKKETQPKTEVPEVPETVPETEDVVA